MKVCIPFSAVTYIPISALEVPGGRMVRIGGVHDAIRHALQRF
jgi:hypothetical protein